MRKMLLSAGFMLAITGCGSESASTNAVSAIPLSIKNPATESSINTAASDTTTSNTVGTNKVATLPEGAFESAAVKQLDEAHTALGKPPGQKAVVRERAGFPDIRAIQIEHMLRLIRKIR